MADYLEYMKFDAMVEPFELPDAFFDENDEFDVYSGMQYLVDAGFIYNNDLDYPTYGIELYQAHPGAYRLLNSFYKAQRQQIIDELVEQGYISYHIEDGEEVLRWTQAGVEYLQSNAGGFEA